MAKAISYAQMAQYLANAGFPADQLALGAAIGQQESSGIPDNRNSIGASGIWQILESAHRDLFQKYNWKDPQDNAKMAYQVWLNAGKSWKPWEAYTTGAYKKYLNDAQKALAGKNIKPGDSGINIPGIPTPGDLAKPFTDLAGSFESFGKILGFLLLPATWVRIASAVLGAVMLVIGTYLLGKSARK